MEQNNNRRSLRNFLLNRRYQLRYTLIMVAISALLTAALGYVWYTQVKETSKVIEVKALGNMSETEVQLLGQEIERQDNQRLLVLIGFGVLLMLVVTIYGIMLTHKVAGPMFKIKRHMADVQQGRLAPIGNIRKGDHLHEFFTAFREMYDALRGEAEAEARKLAGAVEALEQELENTESAAAKDALKTLEELRAGKEDSLKG